MVAYFFYHLNPKCWGPFQIIFLLYKKEQLPAFFICLFACTKATMILNCYHEKQNTIWKETCIIVYYVFFSISCTSVDYYLRKKKSWTFLLFSAKSPLSQQQQPRAHKKELIILHSDRHLKKCSLYKATQVTSFINHYFFLCCVLT